MTSFGADPRTVGDASRPDEIHYLDDELVLLYYAEDGVTRDHLARCEGCLARLATLARVLDGVKAAEAATLDASDGPEPDAAFEARLISRVISRPVAVEGVSRSRVRRVFLPAAGLAALAATLIVGVTIGRERGRIEGEARVRAATLARERVVLSAVSSHLERSRIALVEMRHSESRGRDIEELQAAAGELVRASRLFRVAAERVDAADVAGAAVSAGPFGESVRPLLSIMEETERVLVRFANASASEAATELQSLRRRVESRDLLFRLRVMESQVEKREKALASTVL
jgi:hypothetical protein